jgi:inner membrane protein
MPWWGWIVVGAVLLAAEVVVPTDFFLVFLGASALAVGLLGLIGWDAAVWVQWLAFAALAILSLVFLRGWLRARPTAGVPETVMGEAATATEPIEPGGLGRVELRGSTWSARNAGDEPIAPGDRMRVTHVEGLTLHVRREA